MSFLGPSSPALLSPQSLGLQAATIPGASAGAATFTTHSLVEIPPPPPFHPESAGTVPPLWRAKTRNPPSESSRLEAAAFSLTTFFSSLLRDLEDPERVSFLARLAPLLSQAGLPEDARAALDAADVLASKICPKTPNFRNADGVRASVKILLPMAKAEAACGSRAKAWEIFDRVFAILKDSPAYEHIPAELDIPSEIENYKPALYAELAEALIEADLPDWAPEAIQKIPSRSDGWLWRISVTCRLAWRRAQKEEHAAARRIFSGIRAEIDGNRVSLKRNYGYWLCLLAQWLWEAGPNHHAAAEETLAEAMKHIEDDFSRPWLVTTFLKMRRFSEAHNLISQIRGAENRSFLWLNLVEALADAKNLDEARSILFKKRLFSSHRFAGLLRLARGYRKAGPKGLPAFKETVAAARKFFLLHELFDPKGIYDRHWAARELGRWLSRAGKEKEAGYLFVYARHEIIEDPDSAKKQENLKELALRWMENLILPRVSGDRAGLASALHAAALRGDFQTTRSAAILLGFSETARRQTLADLQTFPEETRRWIKIFLYLGASILPRYGESKDQLILAVGTILNESFASASSRREEKIHGVAAGIFENISPGLLDKRLMDGVKRRISKWAEEGATLIPKSDEILFQSLTRLAQSKNRQSQYFVAQLLATPNLPNAWKIRFKILLKEHGYRMGIPT